MLNLLNERAILVLFKLGQTRSFSLIAFFDGLGDKGHPTLYIYIYIYSAIYMETFSLQSRKPVWNISALKVKQA